SPAFAAPLRSPEPFGDCRVGLRPPRNDKRRRPRRKETSLARPSPRCHRSLRAATASLRAATASLRAVIAPPPPLSSRAKRRDLPKPSRPSDPTPRQAEEDVPYRALGDGLRRALRGCRVALRPPRKRRRLLPAHSACSQRGITVPFQTWCIAGRTLRRLWET